MARRQLPLKGHLMIRAAFNGPALIETDKPDMSFGTINELKAAFAADSAIVEFVTDAIVHIGDRVEKWSIGPRGGIVRNKL